MREKCLYSELFWSVFSSIRAKYGAILGVSPYSVIMQENTDQNNSEYGHFLRSGKKYALGKKFSEIEIKKANEDIQNKETNLYHLKEI